jgi:hypothetical protein
MKRILLMGLAIGALVATASVERAPSLKRSVATVVLPGRAYVASVDSAIVRPAREIVSTPTIATRHAPEPSRVPTPAPLMAFAAAAATRRSGRKKAARTASNTPTPSVGTGAAPVPDAEPVVLPAAGSPLAIEADEEQRAAARKRQTAAAKSARAQNAAGRVGVYEPPDPDESENVAHSGRFDETVEGGRYLHPDGKYRDAEGRVLKK